MNKSDVESVCMQVKSKQTDRCYKSEEKAPSRVRVQSWRGATCSQVLFWSWGSSRETHQLGERSQGKHGLRKGGHTAFTPWFIHSLSNHFWTPALILCTAPTLGVQYKHSKREAGRRLETHRPGFEFSVAYFPYLWQGVTANVSRDCCEN